MLGNVVEQFGSRSALWLQVWNRGGALAEELYVAGGQDVSRSGESGIYHMGTKQAVCALMSMGYQVALSSYDTKRGRYFMTFGVAKTDVGDVLGRPVRQLCGRRCDLDCLGTREHERRDGRGR